MDCYLYDVAPAGLDPGTWVLVVEDFTVRIINAVAVDILVRYVEVVLQTLVAFPQSNPITNLSHDTFRIEVLVISVDIEDLPIRTFEPARAVIFGSAALPAFELGVFAVELDACLVRTIWGREVRIFGSRVVVGEG